MSDGLALFLASCDPVEVSREWTSASLDDALLEVPRHGAKGKDENRQSRATRLLTEISKHDREADPSMAVTVTVYSKPDCRQCVMTKNVLKGKGIDFIEDDLMTPGNLAAAKALGHMAAPVVVAGDQHWSGFRPDKINELADQ